MVNDSTGQVNPQNSPPLRQSNLSGIFCLYNNTRFYRGGIYDFLPQNIPFALCPNIVYWSFGVMDGVPISRVESFERNYGLEKLSEVANRSGVPDVRILLTMGGYLEDYAQLSLLGRDSAALSRFVHHTMALMKSHFLHGVVIHWIEGEPTCKHSAVDDGQVLRDVFLRLRRMFRLNSFSGQLAAIVSAGTTARDAVVDTILDMIDFVFIETRDEWHSVTLDYRMCRVWGTNVFNLIRSQRRYLGNEAKFCFVMSAAPLVVEAGPSPHGGHRPPFIRISNSSSYGSVPGIGNAWEMFYRDDIYDFLPQNIPFALCPNIVYWSFGVRDGVPVSRVESFDRTFGLDKFSEVANRSNVPDIRILLAIGGYIKDYAQLSLLGRDTAALSRFVHRTMALMKSHLLHGVVIHWVEGERTCKHNAVDDRKVLRAVFLRLRRIFLLNRFSGQLAAIASADTTAKDAVLGTIDLIDFVFLETWEEWRKVAPDIRMCYVWGRNVRTIVPSESRYSRYEAKFCFVMTVAPLVVEGHTSASGQLKFDRISSSSSYGSAPGMGSAWDMCGPRNGCCVETSLPSDSGCVVVRKGPLTQPLYVIANQTVMRNFTIPSTGTPRCMLLVDLDLDNYANQGANKRRVTCSGYASLVEEEREEETMDNSEEGSLLFPATTRFTRFSKAPQVQGRSPPSTWSPPPARWHRRLSHGSRSTYRGKPEDESYVTNSDSYSVLYPTSRNLSDEPSEMYDDTGPTRRRHVSLPSKPFGTGDAVRARSPASHGRSTPSQRLHRPRAQSIELDYRQSDTFRRAAQRHSARGLYHDVDGVTSSRIPSPVTPATFTDSKYASHTRAQRRPQQRVIGVPKRRVTSVPPRVRVVVVSRNGTPSLSPSPPIDEFTDIPPVDLILFGPPKSLTLGVQPSDASVLARKTSSPRGIRLVSKQEPVDKDEILSESPPPMTVAVEATVCPSGVEAPPASPAEPATSDRVTYLQIWVLCVATATTLSIPLGTVILSYLLTPLRDMSNLTARPLGSTTNPMTASTAVPMYTFTIPQNRPTVDPWYGVPQSCEAVPMVIYWSFGVRDGVPISRVESFDLTYGLDKFSEVANRSNVPDIRILLAIGGYIKDYAQLSLLGRDTAALSRFVHRTMALMKSHSLHGVVIHWIEGEPICKHSAIDDGQAVVYTILDIIDFVFIETRDEWHSVPLNHTVCSQWGRRVYGFIHSLEGRHPGNEAKFCLVISAAPLVVEAHASRFGELVFDRISSSSSYGSAPGIGSAWDMCGPRNGCCLDTSTVSSCLIVRHVQQTLPVYVIADQIVMRYLFEFLSVRNPSHRCMLLVDLDLDNYANQCADKLSEYWLTRYVHATLNGAADAYVGTSVRSCQ
ncbi:hypothetical protein HPB52_017731 [Rhipicephalus sanguineus]|uniref:GH18 domain-containing protein n=1 Tax=Rhipicephalus sanguineus TaxID=34632 RepID=A0A9D4SUU9_RHISA|nr:hypothetical protein HPB52_017731 [Rhipicephalus sanguineus]